MQCLIKGCNFLLRNIPDEAFIYQRHSCPEYRFQITDAEAVFPYLLVNIGSGVSLIKVGALYIDLFLYPVLVFKVLRLSLKPG